MRRTNRTPLHYILDHEIKPKKFSSDAHGGTSPNTSVTSTNIFARALPPRNTMTNTSVTRKLETPQVTMKVDPEAKKEELAYSGVHVLPKNSKKPVAQTENTETKKADVNKEEPLPNTNVEFKQEKPVRITNVIKMGLPKDKRKKPVDQSVLSDTETSK